jgi:hypothetical protein
MKKIATVAVLTLFGASTAFAVTAETKYTEAAAKHASEAEAKKVEADKLDQDSKAFHRAKAEEYRHKVQENQEMMKYHEQMAKKAIK